MAYRTNDFEAIIEQAVRDTGVSLKTSTKELALYADDQAARLLSLVGQAGYDEAVIAARDNVVLRAGIASVDQADALQARFIGVLQGALGMAAKLLS